MTYGYEVRCEDSWGHSLEALLEPHAQILNFALTAQGLTQALLRYEKDVRPLETPNCNYRYHELNDHPGQ